MSSLLLNVRNLKLSVKTRVDTVDILKGIDFKIWGNETIGIIGESGSGKSIFCKAIGAFFPRHSSVSGNIECQSDESLPQEVLSLSGKELSIYRRHFLAYIFQDPAASLNPGQTCGSQIMEALTVGSGSTKHQAKSKTLKLLKEVELLESKRIFEAYPHQLSGGQIQRVMIAMALASEAKILVADELTASLDTEVQEVILQLIIRLSKEREITLLLISHDIDLLSAHVDRMAVFHQGLLIEEFTDIADAQHPYTLDLTTASSSKPQLHYDREETNGANIIRFENISLSYTSENRIFRKKEKIQALRNVSFTIPVGEALGLYGPSGSGKSSIAKMIVGLVKPSGGTYLFEGQDTSMYKSRDWRILRQSVQYLFQSAATSLNPLHTVKTILREALQQSDKSIDLNEEEAINHILDQVHLNSSLLSRRPAELSGGQRQRVALARAILFQPRCLILDESLSALDAKTSTDIIALIKQLKIDLKLTMIVISHQADHLRELTSRCLIVSEGDVIRAGRTEELLSNSLQGSDH